MPNVELRTTLSMADMEMELELGAGRGQLTITDTAGDEQAAATFYLAIAGDCGPEALVSELYKLAEQVVGDLPMNLRPIP